MTNSTPGADFHRQGDTVTCPHCGFASPPNMKYCGMCGTRLAHTCSKCGFENPLGFRFCGHCGAALGIESPPAAPVAASLPAPVVDVATPVADLRASLPAGERRVATVLIADVYRSTDLLEALGTEAWVEMMNQVLQLLEAEVYHFGGEVDQFRGDGLVAFFGASAAHEDDPERAVLAALRMQKALQVYAAELTRFSRPELRIRVGINTGEVIITSVGGRQHTEDTAMGEAVTIAARMEAAAEPDTVLVSDNTYRFVAAEFEWEVLEPIMVKGVAVPIPVFRPVGLRPGAHWSRGIETYDRSVPLIGRTSEFQALKSEIEGLYDDRGGIALVSGSKGMGKSFLVTTVREYLDRQGMLFAEARSRDPALSEQSSSEQAVCPPVISWLRGRCRSYDQSWPFSMWLDVLYDWLEARVDEPHEALRARLWEGAERLWGAQVDAYYPFLAMFLALPLEEEFAARIEHLDAEALQRQFFGALREWVIALARQNPVVLMFADMHWADNTSLELLKQCLPLCDTEPILWLLVFRPDRASPVWEFRHYVETEFPHRLLDLPIPPLNDEESREFVSRLIGHETLPKLVLGPIIEKAEGNPYYLKELIGALIAQGVLAWNGETGMWEATSPVSSIDLPDSLQTLLLARLDRLRLEERRVLQLAAVIGTVFWAQVLEALAHDVPELNRHLTNLQRAQLIYERRRVPELGMEYAFHSSLIRDVAYESLLVAQRIGYHLRVAEYLEHSLDMDDGATQRYGMVAYHYRQAGKLEKALSFVLRAAEQARGIYANTEVLKHYDAAVEILEDLAGEATAAGEERHHAWLRQKFAVLDERREVHYLTGDMEAGRCDARALLEIARQLKHDTGLLVDALLEQPGVGSIQGRDELDNGIHMAHEALELSRRMGDRRREMRSLIVLTNLHNLRNDPAWQGTGHRALELAQELQDPQAEVEILLRMGWAYGVDNLDQSMSYFEAALPLVQQMDDKSAEFHLLGALRLSLARSGDYYRMLTEYEQRRLEISREIGSRYSEGSALMFCGEIQGLLLGDYEAGLALEREALAIWENVTGKLYPLLRIAQIETAMGRYDEAAHTLTLARPAGARDVRETGRAGMGMVSAILYNAIGDETHLRMALEEVAGVHRMVGSSLVSRQYELAAFCEESHAHFGLATCLEDEGGRRFHREAALQASQTALAIFEHFGFVQVVECSSEEVLYRHAQALELNGHIEEALAFLGRAYNELLRKHALIPEDAVFSVTFLENIALHRDILATYGDRKVRSGEDVGAVETGADAVEHAPPPRDVVQV